MKDILETRFLHWKKHWISLFFWLFLPLVATICITEATDVLQGDSKVPVGIVLEEQTAATKELMDEINSTPFIRVEILNETEALHQLKKHELDSVFIIHEGYQEEIKKGSRNYLLTSYQSDLSFAYVPVKEMIVSYIQQETGRSKTAYIVRELANHYDTSTEWSKDEIIKKAKEVQANENLLTTTFSFVNMEKKSTDEIPIVNMKGLWAICCILSTLLIFDWVINETRSNVVSRFRFTRFSFKYYLLVNFFFYTILLLIVDLISMFLFSHYFHEHISIFNLLAFRIILSLASLLLAAQFKRTFLFYTVSFAITLFIAISSGAILPITGITKKWPWIELLNPIHPFLTGGIINLASIIIIILAVIWYCRKEKIHA